MKKRIISLLMVALMLVSLVPMSVMAESDWGGIISGGDKATIEFTKQPKDVEVGVGGTATFTAEAKVKTSTSIGGILSKVYYIWVDADKTINESVIKELISGIIGDGNTSGDYSLENVQTTDNGKQLKCIAYGGTLINKTLTYAVSNTVTLTVTGGTVDPDPSACKHENLDHQPNTDGTCDPHIEYWYCEDCGSYFTDAACTNKTTKAKLDNGLAKDKAKHTDLKHFPSKAATCTEKGNIEYWYCSGCDNYYSDAAGTVKTTSAKVSTSKNDHD